MWPAQTALVTAALSAFLSAARASPSPSPAQIIANYEDVKITDAEYYSMPALFALDEHASCVATRDLYCVGSFELHASADNRLYRLMQRYSASWVDHYNHTRLHRGLCVSRACDPPPANYSHAQWFESCINSSIYASHNLTASLLKLEYCQRGYTPPTATRDATALAGFATAVLVLVLLSTAADLTLSDQKKKGLEWALSFSLPGCWRELNAPPPGGGAPELQVFDGLRVVCMLVVIVEHVCWLSAQTYVQPRFIELNRGEWEVMLLANSTLVVQIFFLMSSFLLARKLLHASRDKAPPFFATLWDVMLNRIIRVSPCYWVVVWGAASWWDRVGSGPLWSPWVSEEVSVCRRKWWTHLLYLNNLIYQDDKCLIQTWYLSADMQLYFVSAVILLLCARGVRGVRGAPGAPGAGGGGGGFTWLVGALAVAFVLSSAALVAVAYHYGLVPTYFMHSPESVQAAYRGSMSFNWLYQSPSGNVPGALAGVLLAHVHHGLRTRTLRDYAWFRWASWCATPLGLVWLSRSAALALPAGGAWRGAALAALERPAFSLLAALAVLGAMHDVDSPWGRFLSWSGWRASSRLSFCVLLLHLPLNKSLFAARDQLLQLDHANVIITWFGVAVSSYLLALPLCLCVELPAQRLHRALTRRASPSPSPAPAPAPPGTAGGNKPLPAEVPVPALNTKAH